MHRRGRRCARGELKRRGNASTRSGPPRRTARRATCGNELDASRLFELGFAGGLAVDKETRATLGTLLMAMPDEPSAQDIEKLEWTLRNGLPKDDAEKAINMFHGYRAYLGDMKTEAPQLGIPESPEAAAAYFDRVAQVQRRHFDDTTASALFGQEMQEARLVMQASFIHQNTSLDAEAKKAPLRSVRAHLPLIAATLLAGAEPRGHSPSARVGRE